MLSRMEVITWLRTVGCNEMNLEENYPTTGVKRMKVTEIEDGRKKKKRKQPLTITITFS